MGGAKKVFKRVLDPGRLIFDEEKESTPAPDYAAEQAKAEEAAAKKKRSLLNKGRSGTMMGGTVGSDGSLNKAALVGEGDGKGKKSKFGE